MRTHVRKRGQRDRPVSVCKHDAVSVAQPLAARAHLLLLRAVCPILALALFDVRGDLEREAVAAVAALVVVTALGGNPSSVETVYPRGWHVW